MKNHQHHWGGEFTIKKRTGPGPPRHIVTSHVAMQDFVGDSRPPSALFWSDVLDTAKGRAKRATETSLEAERKRFRRKHEIMAFFHG
jgi:hypothetical protein